MQLSYNDYAYQNKIEEYPDRYILLSFRVLSGIMVIIPILWTQKPLPNLDH